MRIGFSGVGGGTRSEIKCNVVVLTFNLTVSPGLVGGYTTIHRLINNHIARSICQNRRT